MSDEGSTMWDEGNTMSDQCFLFPYRLSILIECQDRNEQITGIQLIGLPVCINLRLRTWRLHCAYWSTNQSFLIQNFRRYILIVNTSMQLSYLYKNKLHVSYFNIWTDNRKIDKTVGSFLNHYKRCAHLALSLPLIVLF